MAKSSAKNILRVDMSKVQAGGGRIRVPEDDYQVKIIKAVKGTTQNDKQKLACTMKIVAGPTGVGKEFVDNIVLQENTLWRLANLLDAVAIKWSPKEIALPLDKLVGKELGVTLVDNVYNGRTTSQVGDYLDLETIKSLLAGDDADEDDDSEDDDDEDDDDETDVDDDDDDEL
jgi:hypothetical protein